MKKEIKESIVLIIFRLEGFERNGFLESQYMNMPDDDLLAVLVKLSKKHKIID